MVASLIKDLVGDCDCSTLSGGVDTTFVVLAHPRRNGLKVVTVDLGGDDVVYADLVARKLGVEDHVILRPSDEEFLEAVDWVLRNLRTIDPVEVSADAVHYITSRWALESGCRCLITGDGGDEVFLGYTFLRGKSLEEMISWRELMLEEAWLPTVHVGALVGVRVEAPLYSKPVRDVVRSIPLNCILVKELEGKIVLRLYIELHGLREVAWRRKTPVNVGSGSLERLKAIARRVELDERVLEGVRNAMGFKPPTHLHGFLAYRMLELGVEPPGVVENGCPICGRMIYRSFCRFCGTYITASGHTLHYVED